MLFILLSTLPSIPRSSGEAGPRASLTPGHQISAPISAHTTQKRTRGRPHYELHFALPSASSNLRAIEAYLELSRHRGTKHLAVATLHTFDRTSPSTKLTDTDDNKTNRVVFSLNLLRYLVILIVYPFKVYGFTHKELRRVSTRKIAERSYFEPSRRPRT